MRRKMQEQRSGHKVTGTGWLGLRVAVLPDTEGYFAQGFDVDYFASGATSDEAKRNFELGLKAMLFLHQKKFGNLEAVRPAPHHVVEEFFKGKQFKEPTPHQLLGVKEVAPSFRFSKVLYFEP